MHEFAKQFRLWLFLVSIATALSGCSILGLGGSRDYPLVSFDEYNTTSHNAFNVKGYVLSVSICPPFSMCIRANSLDLTTDPSLIDSSDHEKIRTAHQTGQIISVYGSNLMLRRFNKGDEYLVSVKLGQGVVGASRVN